MPLRVNSFSRNTTCERKVEDNDEVESWHPAGVRFFGAVYRKLGRGTESLDKDKTGARLYASYCVTCHKSPKNVTKFRGKLALETFMSTIPPPVNQLPQSQPI